MDTPDTFTTLIDLLPNPHATFVANLEGMYLVVDCNRLPRFGDYIITHTLKLLEYPGYGPFLGVVIWVISDPYLVLRAQLEIQAVCRYQET